MSANQPAPREGTVPGLLGKAECLELLGSVPVGRVIYSRRAMPAVELVSFVVRDGSILFRTSASGEFTAAIRETVVGFEADCMDSRYGSGWSVTAVGRARTLTSPGEQPGLSEARLIRWAPGPHDHYVSINPEIITGRRVHPADHRDQGQGPSSLFPGWPGP